MSSIYSYIYKKKNLQQNVIQLPVFLFQMYLFLFFVGVFFFFFLLVANSCQIFDVNFLFLNRETFLFEYMCTQENHTIRHTKNNNSIFFLLCYTD